MAYRKSNFTSKLNDAIFKCAIKLYSVGLALLLWSKTKIDLKLPMFTTSFNDILS